jgi:D-arabinose 1-dehydrogenase-like Zn-dependent alcohol dehydrogenase
MSAEALREGAGGADIILATAPNTDTMTESLPGLAPEGTLVALGVGAGEVRADPSGLIGGRRKLIGSPSGSRKDIRATLKFAAHNHVVPIVTKFPLQDAGKVLQMMRDGKLRGRAVLVLE